VNQKHISISSYSDLSRLSPSVKFIHFRKFVSKKIIKKVLCECPKLVTVSFSMYAFRRCNDEILNRIYKEGIKLSISQKRPGRPSMIEKLSSSSSITFRDSIYLSKELNILNVEGKL